jgi:hypothetical protein
MSVLSFSSVGGMVRAVVAASAAAWMVWADRLMRQVAVLVILL